jgi:hypothetical protein
MLLQEARSSPRLVKDARPDPKDLAIKIRIMKKMLVLLLRASIGFGGMREMVHIAPESLQHAVPVAGLIVEFRRGLERCAPDIIIL